MLLLSRTTSTLTWWTGQHRTCWLWDWAPVSTSGQLAPARSVYHFMHLVPVALQSCTHWQYALVLCLSSACKLIYGFSSMCLTWMDRQTDRQTDAWTDAQTDAHTDAWTDAQTGARADRWMDRSKRMVV